VSVAGDLATGISTRNRPGLRLMPSHARPTATLPATRCAPRLLSLQSNTDLGNDPVDTYDVVAEAAARPAEKFGATKVFT